MNSLSFVVGLLLLFGASKTLAQCTLTGSNAGIAYTQAEIFTCLTNCSCSTITITGGKVQLNGSWDLTTKGNIVINIIGTGNALLFGTSDTLTITNGSQINISSGGNIIATGANGAVKIIKGEKIDH